MKRKMIIPITVTVLVLSFFLSGFVQTATHADDMLTIGNSAPQPTSIPQLTQRLVDNRLIATVSVTAEDPNGDSYFMNVCPDTGLPVKQCTTEHLCRTGLAHSGSEISCEFVLPLALDDFYITLCDDHENTRCSGPFGSGYSAAIPLTSEPTQEVLGATTDINSTSGTTRLALLTIGTLAILAAALSIFALNTFKKMPLQRRPVAAMVSSMFVICVTFIGVLALNIDIPQVQKEVPPVVLGETIKVDPVIGRESKAGLYEIFAGPSIHDEVIFYATENEEFPILRETNAWYEVLLPTGSSGWIPSTNAQQ